MKKNTPKIRRVVPQSGSYLCTLPVDWIRKNNVTNIIISSTTNGDLLIQKVEIPKIENETSTPASVLKKIGDLNERNIS